VRWKKVVYIDADCIVKVEPASGARARRAEPPAAR
jgi:hypothetical protein